MVFEVGEVKEDFRSLKPDAFFEKYYLSDDNWYIECYLKHSGDELNRYLEMYKGIISSSIGVEKSDIFMIGSAKLGFSLSPPKGNSENKLFMKFDENGETRKKSDIDIAIVSQPLFERFWKLYRVSYKQRFEAVYSQHIIRETYRGFINENNVQLIDGTRRDWNDMVIPMKTQLQRKIGFKHEINFRVYNSLFDFQDYSKKTIITIQRERYYETI